tara:strand:- start:1432 stop:1653 length:222 start_codon:yes stop_codon:yes gene_type:complete
MKVCQPGNKDWALPEWCVEQEISNEFIIQGVIELLLLTLLIAFYYMRWRMRKQQEEELIRQGNEAFAQGRTFK